MADPVNLGLFCLRCMEFGHYVILPNGIHVDQVCIV